MKIDVYSFKGLDDEQQGGYDERNCSMSSFTSAILVNWQHHRHDNANDAASGSRINSSFTCEPSEGELSCRKRPRSDFQMAMSKLCFTETLDRLSPQNKRDLNMAYIIHEGKLPSRKELRTLSERISVSQSKIRKWFLDRLVPPTPPEHSSPPGFKIEANTPFVDDMEQKMIQLEERLDLLEQRVGAITEQSNIAKSQLDSLNYFSTSWL